jgi:hypothetical protein
LTSANGTYRLAMQADGNLVLYDGGGEALWSSRTAGKPVVQCAMQGDGNLVLDDQAGNAVWASGSAGHPGSHLVVQDDGNVVIYSPSNRTVWSTHTDHAVLDGDQLPAGSNLIIGRELTSADGTYRLAMQTDGNLVLYDGGGEALWSSRTAGKPVVQCAMQDDGNLVLDDQAGNAVWASGSAGHPGSHLVVQDDGNVVIYDPSNRPVWSTHTDHAVLGGDQLPAGSNLIIGRELTSANGKYRLAMQTDGNLVLYEGDG